MCNGRLSETALRLRSYEKKTVPIDIGIQKKRFYFKTLFFLILFTCINIYLVYNLNSVYTYDNQNFQKYSNTTWKDLGGQGISPVCKTSYFLKILSVNSTCNNIVNQNSKYNLIHLSKLRVNRKSFHNLKSLFVTLCLYSFQSWNLLF